MRSRFWMGGPHIAVRNAPGVASRAVRPIASRILGTSEATARNLLVHCAQEMITSPDSCRIFTRPLATTKCAVEAT